MCRGIDHTIYHVGPLFGGGVPGAGAGAGAGGGDDSGGGVVAGGGMVGSTRVGPEGFSRLSKTSKRKRMATSSE